MPYEFKLPDIGEGVVEGEIVRWLVKEGDQVRMDQPMVEVMTDKATVEIPAPRAGTIVERVYAEGQICPVGKILVRIEEAGGAPPAKDKSKDNGKAAAALPAVEAGYFFSIPPSIVRSRQKQKLVKRLPLSCLLVETDSPVLGPVPDARNEPANLSVSIRAIARIKETAEEAVRAAVIENTRRLYATI